MAAKPPSPFLHPLSTLLPPSATNATDATLNLLKNRIPLPSPSTLDLQPHHVPTVLLRCQSDPSASLSFFHWALSHLSPLPPQSYCIVAHTLASSRMFSHATSALSHLLLSPSSSAFDALLSSTHLCNFSPAVFGLLLKALVAARRVPEALDAFSRMLPLGLLPTTDDCNRLMSGILRHSHRHRHRHAYRCWQVYREMKSVGISPNSFTFNILVHALCAVGDPEGALRFAEDTELEGSFHPDVVTYNTLIAGYSRKGMVDDALDLLGAMRRRCIEPDLVSYTVLVKALCREGGRSKDARKLFDEMLQRGLRPGGVVCGALVVGCCRDGVVSHAAALVEVMVRAGIAPGALAYRSLVEGYRREGRLLPCLNLFALLRGLGVRLPLVAYRGLVSSLCDAGRANAARNVVEWALEDGHELDVEMYSTLIGGFCSRDCVNEALELMGEMVAKGIRPNVECYRVLIQLLCKLGRSMEGERLLWEMMAVGVTPDSSICALLVEGYCDEVSCEKAETLLGNIAGKVDGQEISSYNKLISVYCEKGYVARALDLQEKMLKLGIVPNGKTCRLLVRGLSHHPSKRNLDADASSSTVIYA